MGSCDVMDGGLSLIITPVAIITAPIWLPAMLIHSGYKRVKAWINKPREDAPEQDPLGLDKV